MYLLLAGLMTGILLAATLFFSMVCHWLFVADRGVADNGVLFRWAGFTFFFAGSFGAGWAGNAVGGKHGRQDWSRHWFIGALVVATVEAAYWLTSLVVLAEARRYFGMLPMRDEIGGALMFAGLSSAAYFFTYTRGGTSS